MLTPSNDDLRGRSEILTRTFPKPNPADPEAASEVKLRTLAEDEAPVLSSITGRSIGPAGTPGEDVPDYLRGVAVRAMALRLERNAAAFNAKARAKTLKNGNLRSFSAGPYSESYFDAGALVGLKALDPDPTIHELLWALCTDAKKLEWEHLWNPDRPPAPYVGVSRFSSVQTERRIRGY